MKAVLTHVHYLPASYNGHAHTEDVRSSFDKMFQLRALYILEELLSPLLVPYVLLTKIRPRALEIIDFFRCYTIDVDGVGDVCSFATMDLLRHGDPLWNNSKFVKKLPMVTSQSGSGSGNPPDLESSGSGMVPGTSFDIAQEGKTEKSLLHFKAVNPGWQPSDGQVRNWVAKNLFLKRDDCEPSIVEMMDSQSTYNYLSVTKKSLHNSDLPIGSDKLYGMNASMLKLHDSYDRSGTTSQPPQQFEPAQQSSSSQPKFQYQTNTSPKKFAYTTASASTSNVENSMEMSAFRSQTN